MAFETRIQDIQNSLWVSEFLLDQECTHLLKQRGFRVIRFWNNYVLARTELVLKNIFNKLI
jgi:very-short-patch-repair endonuclease